MQGSRPGLDVDHLKNAVAHQSQLDIGHIEWLDLPDHRPKSGVRDSFPGACRCGGSKLSPGLGSKLQTFYVMYK